MNVPSKPTTCERCRSSAIIPVVRGLLASQLWEDLELQKKVLPAGCDGFDPGVPLWGCASCWALVYENRYTFTSYDSPAFRSYDAELRMIVEAYEPLSEAEHHLLVGHDLLEILVHRLFKIDTHREILIAKRSITEFEVLADGFAQDDMSKMFSNAHFDSLSYKVAFDYPESRGNCVGVECGLAIEADSIVISRIA